MANITSVVPPPPAPPALARITLHLTPLASSQFPQVANDLTHVVGVRSTIMTKEVGRVGVVHHRERIFRGGEFSFTVTVDEAGVIMAKAMQAVNLRYGSSSSLHREIFAVPVLQHY
jgi:hypothetical protein